MLATRRFALPALALVALAGGLTACGDDSPETPTSTAPSDTAPAPATEPDATAPATEPDATTPATTGGGDTEPSDSAAGDLPTEESAEVLIDLSEDEAEAAAEERGWTVRVTRRDGEDLPATMDFRDNRVNVEVTDGVVTAIVNIG